MIRPALMLLLLLLTPIAVLPAAAGPMSVLLPRAPLARVPVEPPSLMPRDPEFIAPPRRARPQCVDIDHIVSASVLGERTIELTLDDGQRWHMRFAADCPFVGFYQGFYYRRRDQGRLCAGRDEVLSRSGTACPIEELNRQRRRR